MFLFERMAAYGKVAGGANVSELCATLQTLDKASLTDKDVAHSPLSVTVISSLQSSCPACPCEKYNTHKTPSRLCAQCEYC